MDRAEYNSCMSPYIKGKGISQEERRLNFCAGAKLCTGKAPNIEEAKKICQSQPPKEPKERSSRRSGGSKVDLEALAACIEEHGTDDIKAALVACMGKKGSKTSAPREPAEDIPEVSCTNIASAIDEVKSKIKEGQAEKARPIYAHVVTAIGKCTKDAAAVDLARDINKDVVDLSKRYYFKGEAKEIAGQLDLLKIAVGDTE